MGARARGRGGGLDNQVSLKHAGRNFPGHTLTCNDGTLTTTTTVEVQLDQGGCDPSATLEYRGFCLIMTRMTILNYAKLCFSGELEIPIIAKLWSSKHPLFKSSEMVFFLIKNKGYVVLRGRSGISDHDDFVAWESDYTILNYAKWWFPGELSVPTFA